MPTKPTRKLRVLVQEAKKLVANAKKNLAAFKPKDKDRPLKTPKLLMQIEGLIASTSGKLDLSSARRSAAKLATRSEQERRAALSDALIVVRDDAKDGIEDPEVRRAFGVGKDLQSRSTTELVNLATDVLGAWDAHMDVAKSAGVTKAKIDAVGKAQDALSGADAAQGEAIGARKAATSEKTSIATKLEKLVSRLRERAKSLVRGKKAKSAWKNTAPKAKARKKKAAPPKAPAAP